MNTIEPHEADAPLLSVEGVTKIYRGGLKANDDVSLDIRPGEVFGLLGPNGAGKTTLVNQINGLLKPTSGRILLGGVDVVRHPSRARRLCSYLPQAQVPIDAIPARRAVELIGRIRGGETRAVRERADRLLNALEIDEWSGKLGSRLSGGVRRLVSFAMATVWPGPLVILDEPTNDVDPLRRRLMWHEIRRMADEGSSILLVTHNVLEAERSVDRLAVLDKSRIVAQGTSAALSNTKGDLLRLDVTLEPRATPPVFPAFVRLRAKTNRRMLFHMNESDAPEALDWVRGLKRGGRAEAFEIGPATLEDTYLRLIGREDVFVAKENGNGQPVVN